MKRTGVVIALFISAIIGIGTGCKPPVNIELTDEVLLQKVQHQTFKYFYDFAHPVSGMARVRNSSGDTVTTGGSGFGLMAIITGMDRGYITRSEGLEHIRKMVGFLETCDRYHGAWPHWLNGNTGEVIPFGPKDNGADLVETAFLVQGLITARQYLNDILPGEKELKSRINSLWQNVEWEWFTRGGEHVLYRQWSPEFEWEISTGIRGYNESLITYVLAASSPAHPVDTSAYHEGYARNGEIINGREYYGIMLPLGEEFGGPLFFSQYSFLGLDPRNLEDRYASYWEQNVNHTLINRQYCIKNPNHFKGYGKKCWGLTTSDDQHSCSAHSPTNDLGVIAPTAALSSFPYTPEHSMEAMRHFYYQLGDSLWGEFGFHDAFNLTADWWADSYLARNQGPVIIMIENYRSGLLWELFMSAPEINTGLDRLGFSY